MAQFVFWWVHKSRSFLKVIQEAHTRSTCSAIGAYPFSQRSSEENQAASPSESLTPLEQTALMGRSGTRSSYHVENKRVKKAHKKTCTYNSRALLRLSCLLLTQTYASYQLRVSHGIHCLHLGVQCPCKTDRANVVSHSLISFHNSHFTNPFPDAHFSITFAADFFTLPHPGVSIPGWGQLTSFKDRFATDHRSQPQVTMPHFTTE